jgi:cytochrome c oxidase assembly protein subunit 15
VLAFVVVLARRAKAAGGRRESALIHSAVGTQILLGIWTLLSGVDITLAVAHQGMGVLLLATTLMASHKLQLLRDARPRSAAAAS